MYNRNEKDTPLSLNMFSFKNGCVVESIFPYPPRQLMRLEHHISFPSSKLIPNPLSSRTTLVSSDAPIERAPTLFARTDTESACCIDSFTKRVTDWELIGRRSVMFLMWNILARAGRRRSDPIALRSRYPLTQTPTRRVLRWVFDCSEGPNEERCRWMSASPAALH